MENDATACFDHMIPSLGMVSLHAYGVSDVIVNLIGKTLKKCATGSRRTLEFPRDTINTWLQSPYIAQGKAALDPLAFGY
jgi:hypothetical protein